MANFIDSLPDLSEQSFIDKLPDLNDAGKQEPVEEAAQPEPVEEEGKGILGTALEVPINALGAIGSFAGEVTETVVDWPAQVLSNTLGDLKTTSADTDPEALKIIQDEEGTKLFSAFGTDFNWVSGDGMQKLKELNLHTMWKAEDAVKGVLFDLEDAKNIGMQETTVGQLTGGVSQFIAGWVLLAPVKGLQVSKNAPKLVQFGQATFKGTVVDFSGFDAHGSRMADMAKHFGFENEFINFMAAEGNEDDSIFEGKMKNALEGGAVGTIAEGTVRFLVAAAKTLRAGKRAQDPNLTPEQREAATEEAVKGQEEIQKHFKDPSEVELKTEEGKPLVVETPEKVAQQFEAKMGTVVDTLPPELSKSTPRYNYGSTPIELTFENDIVKALYIVGGKGKSAKHDQYMDFLEQTGIKDIAGEAQKIRDYIKAQAKAGNTEVTIAKVKPRVKYTPAVDAPKPKPKTTEVPKTKEELDLATKEERAEMGSLRSPDDVGPPKVVPIKDTVERGNQLIADLLRNADKDGILGFVKSLKEVTIRPDGFEPAAWVKALDKLADSIDEGLALVDNSAEFKAGDANAVLRKQQLVEARLSLHAQRKASHSGLGRGLVAIRQAINNAFSPNLDLLYGDDLVKAKAKETEKAIKKQNKKKKKSKEKTEIDKAAEEGGLTPSTVDELDPFTKRMFNSLMKTKDVSKDWVDKFVEYGSANLLMGWKTQLINPSINAVMMKFNNFETFGGALFAGIRGDRAAAMKQMRRGKYQAFSLVRNSRVAGRASWETLMTGKNVLDPEFKVKEEVEGAVDDVAIGKGDIDLRKWKESIHEGMTIEDIIGNYVRLSYRGLAAGDEFFKQLNFRGIYGGLIQERLLKQGKHIDIDDASFMRLVDDEVDKGVMTLEKARLKEEPLTEAEEELLGELLYSLNQTREATFTDPLGGLGKWVQTGMNEFPVMRLVMDAWFIRTPLNVFKNIGRRTPVLNLASRRFRRMMFGGNSDDRDRALFEMTYTTLAAYMIYQAVQEEVDVPDGKGGTIKMYKYQGTLDHLTYNNVKNLKLTGLQPHSVYFEDTQTFHNTQRFAPMDNLLMTMVNVRDLENAGMYDEADQLAKAIAISYMNMMKDTTFTSGMTNFVEFINEPEWTFDKYMEAKGRTFTPAALKMMGNDDGRREVDGLWEAMKSGIPFLSKDMEPKFDRLGQPMIKPNQDGLINGLSKATFLASDNAVRMEFLNMNANIADIPRKDGLLDWESEAFDVDGQSAWHRFNEVYATVEVEGLTLEESLEKLILSDEYQESATESTMTPDLRLRGSKESLIINVLNAYEDLAKYTVAQEREDKGLLFMWNKATEAKLKTLSKETKDEVETDPDELLQQFYRNQLN